MEVVARHEHHQRTSVINCVIFGNQAQLGGGINIIRANVSLSGVTIRDNYGIIHGEAYMFPTCLIHIL